MTEIDLLDYLHRDEHTDVILLYLESFGNPRRFSRLARRIGRKKPIVAVKSGRTKAGTRAASSHTGALASADTAVEALFRQSGVIRTHDLFCSPDGKADFVAGIRESDADRIVVAACTPKMHETTFGELAEEAGLNRASVAIANLREQCALSSCTTRPVASSSRRACAMR